MARGTQGRPRPHAPGSRALRFRLGRYRCGTAAEAVAPDLAVNVTAIDVHGGLAVEHDIVTSHPSFVPNRGLLILLAARHRLPAIYPFRYYATEDGEVRHRTLIVFCGARSRANCLCRHQPSTS